MSGMAAAALMALFAGDDPAPLVRVKPKLSRTVVVQRRSPVGSDGAFAALGLRPAILPSWAPVWMQRGAWRIRERLSRIWGLKATVRDSILGGS